MSAIGRKRFTIFPIRNKTIWKEFYQPALSTFWTAGKHIDLSRDLTDFETKLNDNERYYLKQTLKFFAASDTIVNDNLAFRMLPAGLLSFGILTRFAHSCFYSSRQHGSTVLLHVSDDDGEHPLGNVLAHD